MTKLLTELLVDSNEKLVKKQGAEPDFKKMVALANKRLSEESKKIIQIFKEKMESENTWISLGKSVYVPSVVGLIPRIDKTDFKAIDQQLDPQKGFRYRFDGHDGEMISLEEAERIFKGQKTGLGKLPDGSFCDKTGAIYEEVRYMDDQHLYSSVHDQIRKIVISVRAIGIFGNEVNPVRYTFLPLCRLNGRDSLSLLPAHTVCLFLENQFSPQDLFSTQEDEILYNTLKVLGKYKMVKSVGYGKELALDEAKCLNILNGHPEAADLKNIIMRYGEQERIKVATIAAGELKNQLLQCDYQRAMLDKYDEKLLTDPKRGHWDLWDWDDFHKDGVKVTLPERWVARNPEEDINQGIVAIDFGTKSTVVVYENEQLQRLPLQVGNGSYRGGVDLNNYENPTVIQFIDLQSFIKAYNARDGRPYTSWNDMTVSHTAFQNMNNNSEGLYYSFLTNLKQWCGNGKPLVLRDKKRFDKDLPPYQDLDGDEEADPLAYYAYYLGLYINNMISEKHLFMHYIMSFPVTYEKEIREKMLHSFEVGLKKSLPTAILSNSEAMKRFSVEVGASEPAAYAITVLQEYGFDPSGDEKIYYAVFDFGGGTTDFDYGFYQEADSERYDYKLVHFGENGDRTLGGENILSLLAFEVFVHNKKKLLESRIPFTWSADKSDFQGSEAFIKDSQEAHANMHNLMEALRPLWENPRGEKAQKMQEEGTVSFHAFSEDGQMNADFILRLDGQDGQPLDLEQIIQDRILKGIKNFFMAMKESFEQYSGENGIESLDEVPAIAIFLGGNSSKSERVKRLFGQVLGLERKAIPEDEVAPDETSPEISDEMLWDMIKKMDEDVLEQEIEDIFEEIMGAEFVEKSPDNFRKQLSVQLQKMTSNSLLTKEVKENPERLIEILIYIIPWETPETLTAYLKESMIDYYFKAQERSAAQKKAKRASSMSASETSLVMQWLGADKYGKIPEFTIYPALGTEEAVERQEAIWKEHPELKPEELVRPTGKTGVAYGLLSCRNSGTVQVVTLLQDEERTPFQFYVGRNKKRRFHPIINRNTPFNTWHYFIDASNDFDLLYTKMPEAMGGNVSATIAKQIHVILEHPDKEANVYIGPVNANTVAYVVAKSLEEAAAGTYLAGPVEISLE